MGIYLIIISVRINGNSTMNLISAVILDKIQMILICKPLIFKNIFILAIFDSLQEIIRKVQKTKRIEQLLNKCRDHLNDWIGPNNIILQTKYILIKMCFYLIIRILSRITAEIKFMFELPLILTEMIIK